jgi:hypothetical protein
MATKEGGHVSKLLLFLDITFVCFFFSKKGNGLKEGEKGESFLENEM